MYPTLHVQTVYLPQEDPSTHCGMFFGGQGDAPGVGTSGLGLQSLAPKRPEAQSEVSGN